MTAKRSFQTVSMTRPGSIGLIAAGLSDRFFWSDQETASALLPTDLFIACGAFPHPVKMFDTTGLPFSPSL